MRSAAGGWLLWLAVVFGLYDTGLPRERFKTVQQAFGAGHWPGLTDAARAYLTNDGDVRRYFAYAQAARGHPYQSYFVRSADAWRRAFAAGELYRPDESPTLTPAHPLVPYRDYLVEYPPGFFAVTLPPAWLAHDDADAYVRLFQGFMALLLTAAFVLTATTLRRLGDDLPLGPNRMMAWAALATLLLGVVATHRYDAAVALAIVIALSALASRRPIVVGIALGVAIALKGTPVLAVPIVAMHAVRERRLRPLAATAAAMTLTVAAIAVPAVVSAGPGLIETLRYHAARPVQIESTWGAALGLLHAVAPAWVVVEKTFGSTNVAGRLGALANQLSTLATLLGLLAVYVVTWRRLASPDAGRQAREECARVALEAAAATFAVFIACGKVSSPQYLVWLLPLGLGISLGEERRARLPVLLASLALTQLVYPILYGRLESLHPGVCALVLARNGLLLTWAARLLRPRAAVS
jgi:hypothetical protein